MNRETITLKQEEQRRVVVLTSVREGRLTVPEAAALLQLSERHTQRLLADFRRKGPAALAHGNRGRPPHNRLSEALRKRVVRLATTRYAGFNHQHLTEMLTGEEALNISRPTIRRILLDAGVRSPRTRRPRRHRRRRERMPQRGLLLQMDASHHDWLEGRGPRLVLHGAIDDATNEVPAALFRFQEDAAGYLHVVRDIVRHAGCPVAIYTDRHTIFHAAPAQPLTLEAQFQGLRRPPTQLGRAFKDLGIRWIPASSPQAKGRIERLWGLFQDRLVSELRRARVSSLEEANRLLATFLPRYNARFARPPAHPDSAYRPWSSDRPLDFICCFVYSRTVANDNTVQVEGQCVQILPGPHRASYAKAKVFVHDHLDGTRSIIYKGVRLAFRAIPSSPVHIAARLSRSRKKPRPSQATAARLPWKPAANHPWNRMAAELFQRKALKKAGVTLSRNS